jgi:hypothetical protein
LAEVLQRNQGPTRLDYCEIDNFNLANGLRGKGRMQSFSPKFSADADVSNRELLAIAGALRENEGLIELNLSWFGSRVSDEAWGTVYDSLQAHPTLEVLDLRSRLAFTDNTIHPTVFKSRLQALLNMMKVNISIHTIHLDYRLDANSLWMLLSGNVEVAFPSRTTTIAVAANVPTLATAAVTSNANVASVTGQHIAGGDSSSRQSLQAAGPAGQLMIRLQAKRERLHKSRKLAHDVGLVDDLMG